MKSRIQSVLIVLGVFLVPVPFLLSMAGSFSDAYLAAPPTKDPLRALIARQSNLDLFYLGWQKSYLARGGDRNVDIGVAWADFLSTETSEARGQVCLDLINGKVSAEIQGLEDQAADVWLVDNQDGPGRTVRPEPGDRMVSLGSLRKQGDAGTLSATLAPGFFRGFEIDLVVVTPHGKSPANGRLLVGSRPYFERLYTRTRIAQEKTRERNDRLFGPGSVLSLLSPRQAEAASAQVLVDHGLVSQAVAEGADLFFRETFGGNGRTCGTCHRAENNMGLNPDFIATLPSRDKLFIAELPPSQGGVPGLERPKLMRGHGQILMNSDGFDKPTEKFVMRAVPHTLSLATSIVAPADRRGPAERTGWGGDAAPGNGALRLLPNAAVKQHFTRSLERVEGRDFVLPTDDQLDRMEAFLLSLGRLNELSFVDMKLTDRAAENGRLQFRLCGQCHFDAGAGLAGGNANINQNTSVEVAPDPSQKTEPHPHDGGFGTSRGVDFDCDEDGKRDCFGDGTFNVPPLIEAADTAPFFHNHSVATIEAAVEFYTTDVALIQQPLPIPKEDLPNISALLRVLNAAFNSAISIQRNTAALSLEQSDAEGARETVNKLLALSSSEAMDAVEVLGRRKLHPKAIRLLKEAIAMNGSAIAAKPTSTRQKFIRKALADLNAAKAQFGTGLDFTMGEGNLLF
jgi:cytochrome c peroxidase